MIVKLRLTEDRQVIYDQDEAIDRPISPERDSFVDEDAYMVAVKEHEGKSVAYKVAWERYIETYDVAHLPIKPGFKPTIFMVGSLTVAQVAHVQSKAADGFGAMQLEALAYGVHDIRNVAAADERGNEVRPWEKLRTDSPLGPRLTDEALSLFTDDALRGYIWLHVQMAGKLTKEQRKSG